MNRFHVMPCVDQSQINEDSSGGLVLPLASEIQNNCILFFPVSDEVAQSINYVLEVNEDDPHAPNMVEVYKTMVNTWRAGDRFLSGIYIDLHYDPEIGDEVINVNIMLSSVSDGIIDAISRVGFIDAIIISVLENMDIMISTDLLRKLLPEHFGVIPEDDEFESDELEDHLGQIDQKKDVFPIDENILDIAKKIMKGKIK